MSRLLRSWGRRLRILADRTAATIQNLIRLCVAAQIQGDVEQHLIAAREFSMVIDENIPLGTVTRVRSIAADAGGTYTDVFHRSCLVPKFAIVADRNRSVADDGDASEQILDGLLRRQSDGESADPEPGKNG